jgi:branched-chain amino acid transport system ATP-binding protein
VKNTLEFVYGIFPVLRERKNQLAGCLSGGESRMLAIGRALMARPKMLMLDEPSLGLAPKIVVKVFDEIKKIRNEGVTILLVEQNVRSALELSDVGYVLETGKVVLGGCCEEILKEEHIKRAYLGA